MQLLSPRGINYLTAKFGLFYSAPSGINYLTANLGLFSGLVWDSIAIEPKIRYYMVVT